MWIEIFALLLLVFALGVAVGGSVQERADKKDCNACWSSMYERAWTLSIDGQDIKVMPIYEYGAKKGDET